MFLLVHSEVVIDVFYSGIRGVVCGLELYVPERRAEPRMPIAWAARMEQWYMHMVSVLLYR